MSRCTAIGSSTGLSQAGPAKVKAGKSYQFTEGSLKLEITFTLVEGEKMICDVILPRNEVKGEITKYCIYQTLSIFAIQDARPLC